MSETWISWAIRAPIPDGYDGYGADTARDLDEILYIVNHSGEGYAPALIKGHRPHPNPNKRASWTFSNLYDGTLYQHAPLEALTYTSGSYTANREGIGREHEGVTGEPLTPEQVATDRKLDAELATLCRNLRPLVLGQGYREHSELTGGATSCPSGRIQPLYDSYESEESMQILKTPSGAQYVLGQYKPVPLTFDYVKALSDAGVPTTEIAVTDAQFKTIYDNAPAVSSGDGSHRHE